MAKLYLVRHGESLANTKGVYQGQTYNTPLSPMGEKQANKLAEYFDVFEVDNILASPLTRTRETAKRVADRKHMLVIDTPEIIETNHGSWEGIQKQIIEKRWPNLYRLWTTRPAQVKFPGGETFQETNRRVLLWWSKVIRNNENTLILTHDNIIRIIVAEVLGLNLNNIWRFELNPAAITIIEAEQGTCRLLALDEKCHLKNLSGNLANHAL